MAKKKTGIKIPTLSSIRKSYDSGLASDICLPPDKQLWLPSRSLLLNYSLGGGIPYGKIMEIFGAESSGKSLIAMDFGYVAQSCGGVVLLNDAEQSFSRHWAEQNKLDISKIEICNEVAVERVSDWLLDTVLYYRSKLTNNEPIVFIQDSLAALDCLDNINSKQTDAKAEMGNRAKAIYKMIRIRNKMLTELGVVSIFINQIRHKVGAGQFEDPSTTPGGNAMKFYAAQRVGIYAGKQEKAKLRNSDQRVGVNVSIRLIKNKVAPPRPTFKSIIYFNADYKKPLGIDRYIGLPEVFLYEGVVTKKGHGFYFEGNRVATSQDDFLNVIEKDKALRSKLISGANLNTVSKLKSQLKTETINLYPVKEENHERQSETEE